MSPNGTGFANDKQTTSSSSMITSSSQVPMLTDQFNLSEYCRLCATSVCDGTLLNVETDNVMKELIRDMSNRLNINIDFSQEHLPTTVCTVCIKSLCASYDFVVGIDLAQISLNKMSVQKHNNYQKQVYLNHDTNLDLSNTSLQQTSNESEACDLDPWLQISSETTFSLQLLPKIKESNIPLLLDSPRKRRLKDTLNKKRQIIDQQKKNIKRLNQKEQ
ncbi:uncharacterized protein LOC121737390 [Aricia agestis]|uniref:uncharacterized protein LOC121737390 n=1 Tax=Aricia agestis TaxID=91739 RepID=UPI001C207735|nr:uncharacterized protein LOC121737390 [Aricia agestis]